MRIGEWSSDVCPSDLYVDIRIIVPAPFRCIYAIARKDDVGLRHLYLRHGVTGARHHVGLIGEGKALVAARDGESRLARRRDLDRQSVVSGNSVSVRLYYGGRRIINKNIRTRIN